MVEIAYALITGLLGVVGSGLAGIATERSGWADRALKMVELYERLPRDRYQGARDGFVALLLRDRIYETVARGLGYRFSGGAVERRPDRLRYARPIAATGAASLALGLLAMGVPGTAAGWFARLAAVAVGSAAALSAVSVLRRWPRRGWNGFYMAELSRREDLERMRSAFDAMDRLRPDESAERPAGDARDR